MYDIFITHDWRENDDYKLIIKSIDVVFQFGWRNYSNTWHDPRLRINNQSDVVILEELMREQIAPSNLVIKSNNLSKDSRGRKWLEYSLAVAKELEIPILEIDIENLVNENDKINEEKLKDFRKEIILRYIN